jgi:chromate reductase
MKHLFAISGSTKTNSSNEKILAFISDQFKDEANIEIYSCLKELPYFEPGLNEDQLPEEVKKFLLKINAADAILISTPEYVFSLPGILKNALEWTVASTVLSDKAVGIIVAAASGEKAFESLELIMSTLTQSSIAMERKLLIKGIGKYFDGSGQIIDKNIKAQLISLTKHLLS